jgi:hypothetical protein
MEGSIGLHKARGADGGSGQVANLGLIKAIDRFDACDPSFARLGPDQLCVRPRRMADEVADLERKT